MTIHRQREIAISIPDLDGLGSSILAALWTADACVVGSAASLTHLEVRSLHLLASAFASTAQSADSRYRFADARHWSAA